MKRIIFVAILGVASVGISAQTIGETESDSVHNGMENKMLSPSDSIFAAAEEQFMGFFRMSANPAADKKEMYGTLLECFMNYVKSMDTDNEERLSVIKEKVRKLRPAMEDAGIYYSQANDNATAYEYIKCFLNIPMLPMFEGERFMQSGNYPSLVLFAATEAYNAKELEEAVTYFQEYLELGAKHRQETCYTYLAVSLENLGRYEHEGRILEEGLMNYPDNMNMLRLSVNYYHRKNDMDKAKEYLEHALVVSPNDRELIYQKANFLELDGKFQEAAELYKKLQESDPENMIFVEKQALCYYNIGGSFINESNTQTDGAEMKRLRDEAVKNYNIAIPLLKRVVVASPNDTRYIAALADAYRQTGNPDAAKEMQTQIESRNESPLLAGTQSDDGVGIPNFNKWVLPIINEDLEKWTKKDPYETTEEFTARVNSESRKARAIALRQKMEEEFIAQYSNRFDTENMTLKPYDADHQTFKIQTRQGPIYLQVPREEDKAKNFQKQWHSVRMENPKYAIDKEGNMVLSELLFVQGDGTSYFYDARKDLSYENTNVTVVFDRVEEDDIWGADGKKPNKAENNAKRVIVVGESDVDIAVPRNKRLNSNTCAFIICNEEYKNTGNVEFAKNDGNSFYNYCLQTLGIPGKNIYMQDNATGGDIDAKLDMVKSFIASRNGDARVIMYYSGHGLPDPTTGEAYLLPVDAYPKSLRSCRKLSDIYAQLCEYPSQSVTVFIDACFSGAKRDGAMMDVAARGVAIKPKPTAANGKMVVFTACTGEETAYPYKEQKHGMFTYFLLKILQAKKGNVSYQDIADYIKENVSKNSLDVNSLPQTPTVTASASVEDVWRKWRLDREE